MGAHESTSMNAHILHASPLLRRPTPAPWGLRAAVRDLQNHRVDDLTSRCTRCTVQIGAWVGSERVV